MMTWASVYSTKSFEVRCFSETFADFMVRVLVNHILFLQLHIVLGLMGFAFSIETM